MLQRDKAVVRMLTTSSRGFASAWANAGVRVSITRPNLLTLLQNEAELIKQRNQTAFTARRCKPVVMSRDKARS